MPFETELIDDPTFVPRLTWSILPSKVHWDPNILGPTIEKAPDQLLFVADSSFFDVKTDTAVYEAFLSRGQGAAVTPRVLLELEPWFNKNTAHVVTEALSRSDRSVRTLQYSSEFSPFGVASDYYARLMAARKSAMSLGRMELERTRGAPAGPDDESGVRAIVQSRLGERGFLLARKGQAKTSVATWLTDEEVVYLATQTAIIEGRPVIILTKDEDLEEQFYKLLWMIDTHYRSMLIGKWYVENFAATRTESLIGNPVAEHFFDGIHNILVEGPRDLPLEVLPSASSFIAISCWIVGERYHKVTFESRALPRVRIRNY